MSNISIERLKELITSAAAEKSIAAGDLTFADLVDCQEKRVIKLQENMGELAENGRIKTQIEKIKESLGPVFPIVAGLFITLTVGIAILFPALLIPILVAIALPLVCLAAYNRFVIRNPEVESSIATVKSESELLQKIKSALSAKQVEANSVSAEARLSDGKEARVKFYLNSSNGTLFSPPALASPAKSFNNNNSPLIQR